METKISILKDLIEISRSLQSELIRIEASTLSKEHLSSAAARVIVLLHDSGALSVPYIGRAVGTSRQNIQMVANRLLKAGVVMTESNPHHKRSSRILLTERGSQLHQLIVSRQNKLLRAMAEKVSDEDLHGAIRCLRTLRDQLKSPADQKRIQPSRPGSRNQPGPGGVPPKPVPREESPPTTEDEEMPLSLL